MQGGASTSARRLARRAQREVIDHRRAASWRLDRPNLVRRRPSAIGQGIDPRLPETYGDPLAAAPALAPPGPKRLPSRSQGAADGHRAGNDLDASKGRNPMPGSAGRPTGSSASAAECRRQLSETKRACCLSQHPASHEESLLTLCRGLCRGSRASPPRRSSTRLPSRLPAATSSPGAASRTWVERRESSDALWGKAKDGEAGERTRLRFIVNRSRYTGLADGPE